MYVVTADQVDSRNSVDAVGPTIGALNREFGGELALAPDRTAGDEFQTVTGSAATALAIVLKLTRAEEWSVGLGIGPVDEPLGENARESTGSAFIAAREAVQLAKKRSSRLAIATDVEDPDIADFAATLDLLLLLRARRSDEGWELYDLLADGLSQREAAKRLGITPQAASYRARAAEIKAETASIPAFERRLAALDWSSL